MPKNSGVSCLFLLVRLIHSLVRNHRIDSASQVQTYYHYQDIECLARLFKVSHSTSPASETQTKSESVVVGPKSILKSSDAKVMKKCFLNGSMTAGDGKPWEKGHTWSTQHLGEWVFAGPALGWYRRDTTSLAEHRKLVAQEPEMVIDDPPCTDTTPARWHMARAMRAAERRGGGGRRLGECLKRTPSRLNQ